MEICNLKKGMEIKNYKELCNVLNIKTKAGNSKKSQLKELERYCNYIKEGNRFIIKEIYKDPKIKEDGRKTNNSIYEDKIEKILLWMCKYSNENRFKKIELSVTGMLCSLNMINKNFNIGRQQIKKFSRYLEIPIQTIYDFYNSTYNNLENNVVRVLNKLQNRCLIDWTYITKIKTLNNEYRAAHDEEIEFIKETELKILKELNCNDKKTVFINGKWNEFNKKVNRILKEEIDVEYYYKAYKIITTEEFRKMIFNFNEEEIEESKIELNYLVETSCNKSANNRHIKAIENNKNVFGLPKSTREQVRIRPQYITDSKKVINICIDNTFNSINLVNELNKIGDTDAYDLLEALIDEKELEDLL